ncbi:MAG: hypothetical protein F6K10_22045 [Moorea sp. SIO2B7]|nr:hypothetical protein [Moorena sp. SIO2B7]
MITKYKPSLSPQVRENRYLKRSPYTTVKYDRRCEQPKALAVQKLGI